MIRSRSKKVRAFTLVELLVVVLILSILMSVALPLYLSAVSDAQKTCRSNMQTIANTVVAGKVKLASADFSSWIGNNVSTLIAASPDKLPDLLVSPVCPNGGTYAIAQGNTGTTATFKVTCTVAVHGTFQPGVDGN